MNTTGFPHCFVLLKINVLPIEALKRSEIVLGETSLFSSWLLALGTEDNITVSASDNLLLMPTKYFYFLHTEWKDIRTILKTGRHETNLTVRN